MKKSILLKFLIIFICFGWIACKSDKAPEGILPVSTMKNITQDLLLIDGYITTISRPDSAVMLQKSYKNALFKHYKTDSMIFKKSADFYNANPKLIEEMYQDIQKELDTLNKKQQKRFNPSRGQKLKIERELMQ